MSMIGSGCAAQPETTAARQASRIAVIDRMTSSIKLGYPPENNAATVLALTTWTI
jgi:hypothetical protein